MTPVEQLVNVLRGGVALVIVLTVLVAVHELGHYLAARMYGMKVDAFAVFLGGLRKTDLRGHLMRPLGPTGPVWLTGALGGVAFLIGSSLSNVPVAVAGLVVFGLAVPLWVAGRLEQLYHLGQGNGLRRVGIGAGLVGFAAAFMTRTGNTSPDAVKAWLLTVVAAAALGAWFGVMATYWAPTFSRVSEPTGDPGVDEQMGHGAIMVEGQPVAVRFRPVWFTQTRKGEELALNLLPLGGFVKVHGAHPSDDGSEVNIPGGMYSKGPWPRFVVFAAGPAFSLALGVLLIWVGLMGQGKVGPLSNVIDSVQPDTAAAAAHLRVGDRIVAVNGKPVTSATDFTKEVRYSYDKTDAGYVGRPVSFDIVRGSEKLAFVLVPKVTPQEEDIQDENGKVIDHNRVARIGVGFKRTFLPVSTGEALATAAAAPVEAVTGLFKLKSVSQVKDNVGGIGTVAAVTASAAQVGIWPVVNIAGLLSISLGIMNLLPIVPLDGGQMAVAVIELFRGGKRISPALQSLVANVGVLLIVLLAVTVLSVDVGRFAGGTATPPAKTSGK